MMRDDALQEAIDCGQESDSLRCYALQHALAEYIARNKGSQAYERGFSTSSDAGYFNTRVVVWAGSYKGATVVLESQLDTYYNPHNASTDERNIVTNRLQMKVSPKNIEIEKIFDELKEEANSRIERHEIVRKSAESHASVLNL